MKLREPSLVRCSAPRLRHCLALLLLAGGNATSSRAGGRIRIASPSLLGYTWVDSIPYAIVAGAPPLRFAPEPPMPELPVVIVPAPPVESAHSSSPILPIKETSAVTAETVSGTSEKPTVVETTDSGKTQPEGKSSPAAILPDDLHPQVRPEDFLPFFQVPGGTAPRNGGQMTIVVPVTATTSPAPATNGIPSSATYTQTPK